MSGSLASRSSVATALKTIEVASRASADTDEIIEKWVKYAQTSGDRVKKIQHELRQKLMDATGPLDDLRERLRSEAANGDAA